MWTDVFVGLGVLFIKFVGSVLNWVIVFPTVRWTDVFVGILVVKKSGFIWIRVTGG